MNVRRSFDSPVRGLLVDSPQQSEIRNIFSEEQFHRMISRERRRTERSRKPFLLMLLDMGDEPIGQNGESSLGRALAVLSSAIRETDAVGWYKTGLVVGVMFTEIEAEDKKHILNTMLSRVSNALEDRLSFEQFNQLSISFHWFPEEWGHGVPKRPSNPVFYHDISDRGSNRVAAGVKRIMDVLGSLAALVIFSPLFAVIGLAIKLTSKGPVIFQQERMGQFGKAFVCLKFRTMYANNDLSIHKEFMKRVIHGQYDGNQSDGGAPVYTKMPDDPRITAIGHFLRRTSLDELPQFINVLLGDMSLVGPRPPLAYEFQQYQVWHRRRVLEMKPGITGLWQVNGRNRVRFDDQVRLDLRYLRTWTPWLDLQILLQTPKAVFWSDDAF